LRSLLLEAGREILHQEGVETGSNNLTFKRAFEHLERTRGLQVTNASVIRRVWENQVDFQADVLVAVAEDEGRPEIDLTLHAVAAVLAGADRSTVEGRVACMRELCRVGGAASSDAVNASPNWSLWIFVLAMATTSSQPEQRHRVRSALLEGYASVNKFWVEVFGGLTDFLGLRLRPPWTMDEFTVAAIALGEGYSIRQHLDGEIDRRMRPTGPHGEDQEWTLFAAGLEALANQFFEPDPDFDPAA
jgi:hypothetical protein